MQPDCKKKARPPPGGKEGRSSPREGDGGGYASELI